MATIRAHHSAGKGWTRRRLSQVAGVALGLAMFGTVALSGTLAQEDDVTVGTADAETIVNAIIADVFAAIFGGDVTADDSTVSGGGDIDVGGSTGSTVTMGGGDDISIGGGGSGSGVTVGDSGGE